MNLYSISQPIERSSQTHFTAFVSGLIVVLALNGCAGDRYTVMMEAAEERLNPLSAADDHASEVRLHQALVDHFGFSALGLATYVFMNRGYVVGYVDSPEQAQAVFETAKTVKGLQSIEAVLPVKQRPSADAGKVTADSVLKSQIESALTGGIGMVSGRVHVEVLNGRVVLLGVVSGGEDRERAERAAAGTMGVTRVTNWLLLPDTEYMAIRSQVF
ncbi:MAG TPA: BON domain-containing protein [Nitrospira sp.]|nr:BON domain-containing protein [Nitrospira sp.]